MNMTTMVTKELLMEQADKLVKTRSNLEIQLIAFLITAYRELKNRHNITRMTSGMGGLWIETEVEVYDEDKKRRVNKTVNIVNFSEFWELGEFRSLTKFFTVWEVNETDQVKMINLLEEFETILKIDMYYKVNNLTKSLWSGHIDDI